MKTLVMTLPLALLTVACTAVPPEAPAPEAQPAAAETAPPPETRPETRPEALAPPPPSNATTAESFDTTTQADRIAAVQPVAPEEVETSLGRSIASLGTPTEPGFWIKTPLVKAEAEGRVVLTGSGQGVQVTLIPIPGEAGAGSRLSLAALRALDADLTGLHEVEIFRLK